MIDVSKYVRWDTTAMCAALAVVFVFEMFGIFTDRYVTITAIVRGVLPRWARAAVLGWLAWHFLSQ